MIIKDSNRLELIIFLENTYPYIRYKGTIYSYLSNNVYKEIEIKDIESVLFNLIVLRKEENNELIKELYLSQELGWPEIILWNGKAFKQSDRNTMKHIYYEVTYYNVEEDIDENSSIV